MAGALLPPRSAKSPRLDQEALNDTLVEKIVRDRAYALTDLPSRSSALALSVRLAEPPLGPDRRIPTSSRRWNSSSPSPSIQPGGWPRSNSSNPAVIQLVEHRTHKPGVARSSRASGTTSHPLYWLPATSSNPGAANCGSTAISRSARAFVIGMAGRSGDPCIITARACRQMERDQFAGHPTINLFVLEDETKVATTKVEVVGFDEPKITRRMQAAEYVPSFVRQSPGVSRTRTGLAFPPMLAKWMKLAPKDLRYSPAPIIPRRDSIGQSIPLRRVRLPVRVGSNAPDLRGTWPVSRSGGERCRGGWCCSAVITAPEHRARALARPTTSAI